MSLQEREAILKFHPDFKEGADRRSWSGRARATASPMKWSSLLHAKSRVDPDAVDLSSIDHETDVLIIGGGGAGTSAALLARENGAKVLIATKLRLGDANTMMAEGGIQAATKTEKDSPYYHYLDVMGGGHFKNDPELVETLVVEAPKVMAWLENLGACSPSSRTDGSRPCTAAARRASGCTTPATSPAPRSCARSATRSGTIPTTSRSSSSARPSSSS